MAFRPSYCYGLLAHHAFFSFDRHVPTVYHNRSLDPCFLFIVYATLSSYFSRPRIPLEAVRVALLQTRVLPPLARGLVFVR